MLPMFQWTLKTYQASNAEHTEKKKHTQKKQTKKKQMAWPNYGFEEIC